MKDIVSLQEKQAACPPHTQALWDAAESGDVRKIGSLLSLSNAAAFINSSANVRPSISALNIVVFS